MDLDVRGLALESAAGLVDEDPRVREGRALAFAPAGEQQRAHRHRHPEADGRDVGLDELHRVVDRQPGVDLASRGVDVEADVLVGVFGLQVQQLGDDEVGDLVVDGRADEHDPLVEQARVDVEGALAAGALLDDHRDEWHGASRPPMIDNRMVGNENSNQMVVKREIEIEAAAEEVWEAVNDPEQWLGEEVDAPDGLERGSEFVVRDADGERHGRVEVSEPPARRVWWWWREAEPATRVEVLVVAAPASTRVVVVETAPATAPALAAGWATRLSL